MYDKIIVDADICLKLGCDKRYRFLVEVLPLVSKKIYMHSHAYGEVLSPQSAVDQLKELIGKGIVEIVDEKMLSEAEQLAY